MKISAGTLLGGLAFLFFGYKSYKMHEIAKRVDLSIDDLATKQKIEIDDAVLEKVVSQSVDRQVADAVERTIRAEKTNLNKRLNERIREDVTAEYDRISEEVAERVADQVEELDMEKIKHEIKDKVEARLWESVSPFARMLGGTVNGVTDLTGLDKILDRIPWHERGEVAKAFGVRGRY